jgi:hypothetical protein
MKEALYGLSVGWSISQIICWLFQIKFKLMEGSFLTPITQHELYSTPPTPRQIPTSSQKCQKFVPKSLYMIKKKLG